MTKLGNALVALALLAALAPRASAQEDNAGQTSGYDPRAAPSLKAKELELPLVTERQGDKLFGIGYASTPGGVTGAALEYYLGGTLLLEGVAGLTTISPKSGSSATGFAVAAGVFYRWKSWDNVSLMLGGRLDIGHVSLGASGPGKLPQTTTGSGSRTQFDLEVPLRAQIYFARYLAVHAEVAAVLSIIGDGGAALDSAGGSYSVSRAKGVYLDLPLAALLGSFGATFYFN